jgi:hypothetical protein
MSQLPDTLKRFVMPTWARVLLFFGALIASAGAVAVLRVQGWSLASVGLCALAVFAVAGLADSLLGRVELHPDKLVIVSNFRKREYPRAQFKRATWAKGVPVALEFVEGGWLQLPDFVAGGPGVLGTFRAWLRNTGDDARTNSR